MAQSQRCSKCSATDPVQRDLRVRHDRGLIVIHAEASECDEGLSVGAKRLLPAHERGEPSQSGQPCAFSARLSSCAPSLDASTARRRHLSGRKAKDTQPEVLLRSALHAAGARFRLHRCIAKGCTCIAKGCTPDLLLPGRRVAGFVDGNYWRGCPIHFPDRRPGVPNAALWLAKFEAVKERTPTRPVSRRSRAGTSSESGSARFATTSRRWSRVSCGSRPPRTPDRATRGSMPQAVGGVY
jgi:DNA mismatch endonuclease Vsr